MLIAHGVPQFEGIVAHGGEAMIVEANRSWPRGTCSQEAKKDADWYSASFLLLGKSRNPSHDSHLGPDFLSQFS